MKVGDIVWHKLGPVSESFSEPMIISAVSSGMEVEVRYKDHHGIYHIMTLHRAELQESEEVPNDT